MADPRLSTILDRSGDPATVAWAHEGAGVLSRLPDPKLAIEAAVALKNVNALAVAAEQPLPKELRKAAGAGLHRLKSQGIKPAAVAARSVVLGSEVVEGFFGAYLSLPDSSGEFEALLGAAEGAGASWTTVRFGGVDGLERLGHDHTSRSELRRIFREVDGRSDSVKVPFVLGLHLAARVAYGEEWDHFLAHLPAELRAEAGRLSPLVGAPPARAEDPGLTADAQLFPAEMVDFAVVEAIAAERQAPEAPAISADVLQAAQARVAREGFSHQQPAILRHMRILSIVYHWYGLGRCSAQIDAQVEQALRGEPVEEISAYRAAAQSEIGRAHV